MKKLILILLCVLIVGCSQIEKPVEIDAKILQEKSTVIINETVEVEPPKSVAPSKIVQCTQDLDCKGLEKCIDNECSLLTELNSQDCDIKCNYKSAIITTSDGETLDLVRGQGSYTAAGAIGWKLLNSGEYCQGSDVKIAIEIEKKSYGKILSSQIVTSVKGETSVVITHPTVKIVNFTLKVVELVEEC